MEPLILSAIKVNILSLQLKTSEIKSLIEKREKKIMSTAEWKKQSDSFVLGNSFDIFNDSNFINEKTVKRAQKNRLLLYSE